MHCICFQNLTKKAKRAVSEDSTGTERVTGEPVMPLDVTTTVAFPSPLKKDLQYLAETSVNFQT